MKSRDLPRETAALIRVEDKASWTYCAIVWEQLRAGDIAGAKETAALIADELHNPADSIAVAQAQAGDFSGAKQTAATISNDPRKADTYCRIVVAQAVAGDVAGCKATIEQIAESRNIASYHALAWAQARAGDPAGARDTLDKVKPFTELIKKHGGVSAWGYRYAAGEICVAGDVSGAIKVITDATDDPRQRCEWLIDLTKQSSGTQQASKTRK